MDHYSKRAQRVGVRAAGVQSEFVTFLRDQSPVVHLIHQEMQRGSKCSEALNFICGEGSFERLAEEIWNSCRSLQAA